LVVEGVSTYITKTELFVFLPQHYTSPKISHLLKTWPLTQVLQPNPKVISDSCLSFIIPQPLASLTPSITKIVLDTVHFSPSPLSPP
jgi:hypothetical protein